MLVDLLFVTHEFAMIFLYFWAPAFQLPMVCVSHGSRNRNTKQDFPPTQASAVGKHEPFPIIAQTKIKTCAFNTKHTCRRRRFLASQGKKCRQTFEAVCSTALRVLAFSLPSLRVVDVVWLELSAETSESDSFPGVFFFFF